MNEYTFYYLFFVLGIVVIYCLWILIDTDPDELRKEMERKYSKGELDANA